MKQLTVVVGKFGCSVNTMESWGYRLGDGSGHLSRRPIESLDR